MRNCDKKRGNLLLLLGLLGLIALNAAINTDYARRNVEFFPEMVHSIPFDAQAANPVFADGKTQQSPVAGTLARGETPFHFGPEPEEALRAGEEWMNPLEPSPAALKRGAVLYNRFCLPCHGPEGRGDGPIALRGYPPPPSLSTDKAMTMEDGQLFHLITHGQANMPSYAGQITSEDRWPLVHHVRALQATDAAKRRDGEAAKRGPNTEEMTP